MDPISDMQCREFVSWALQNQIALQQAEIDEAFEKENPEGTMLEYSSIQGLQYMGMVMQETLRKYPPTGGVPRTCTKEYTFPGKHNYTG